MIPSLAALIMYAACPQGTRYPLCNYYSANRESLEGEIESSRRFFAIEGPATNDEVSSPHPCSIILVPHGAFCDSGPLVAHALQICVSPEVDTVILIGTEHSSASTHKISCSNYRFWRTPLGDVDVDERLLAMVKEFVPVGVRAFAEEHSIENQLPFLQKHLEARHWSMVAISVHGTINENDLSHITNVGKKLADLIEQEERHVAVVATTDYTHAGPFYGELPTRTGQSIPEYIREKDAGFIQYLCTSELPCTKGIFEHGRRISMCGLGATLLSLELARNLGRRRARLLKYAVGSDICNRGVDDQTGFASIVFE